MYLKIILLVFVNVYLGQVTADEHSQLNSVIQEAQEKQLAQTKEWLALNQVWNNIFGIEVSRIDDEEYFQSGTKYDLEKELISFLENVLVEDEYKKGDDSLQCQFPARFFWLNKELKLIDRGQVKKAQCKEFEIWQEALDVSRIVLVFPAAYLNNPASMFGHTLLRLDSRSGIDNPLLSYAASFGATTGEDGGVAFALKGLLGGYRASFTVEPYYETVERYGDIEHRDIWEYELILSADERAQLVRGLWEYGHTFVDYYFFDENCSFYLLTLLDIARPGSDLANEFSYWAIPSDTLKEVLKRAGLLGKITYRPSLSKKLERQSNNLSNEQISRGIKIAKGEAAPNDFPSSFTNVNKSLVLEFAFDYLEYLNSSKQEQLNQDRAQAQLILKERSLLPETGNDQGSEIRGETRPDETHESSRVLFGVGRKSGRGFYDVQIKPAYHDNLDSPRGFVKGAAIDFFNIGMRQYESDSFQLQSLNLVNVESYSPWTKVFTPKSWSVKFGYERKTIPRADSRNVEGSSSGFLTSHYGVTLQPLEDLFLSVLPGVKATYAPSYHDHDYAIAGGISSRLIYQATDTIRFLVTAEHMRFEFGEDHRTNQMSLESNYDLSKELIVRAGIQRYSGFSEYFNEFYLALGLYF